MSKSSPSSRIPTVDEIRAKVCTAAFGGPLVSNIYRGWWPRSLWARRSAPNGNYARVTGAVGISSTQAACAWK